MSKIEQIEVDSSEITKIFIEYESQIVERFKQKYNIVDLESDISKIRYVKKIEKNREKVYQFSYRKVNDSDLDKQRDKSERGKNI